MNSSRQRESSRCPTCSIGWQRSRGGAASANLGLAFVTQLPMHLSDEVLGLINNWILHKLTDSSVVHRLRKVVPGDTEAT